MSITNRGSDRPATNRSPGRSTKRPVSRLALAAGLLLANASVAFGQAIEEAPAGDPIEETWRYLVELFRMILGL